MAAPLRTPETCPHRGETRGYRRACGLGTALGGSATILVGDEQCGYCCRVSPAVPTAAAPGHMVASLVLTHAMRSGDAGLRGRVARHVPRISPPPRPIPADLPATLAELFPAPRRRTPAPRPVGWAVGVMVAPRLQNRVYLPGTLAAIAAAGWPDPVVFAEPGAEIPPGTPNVERWVTRRGCWAAQREALAALVNPRENRRCEAILLFEDDSHPCPGLRAYLEDRVLWPAGRLAGLNLFLSSGRAHGAPGWAPGFWGGQALLFSRESATAYLGDRQAAQHEYDPEDASLDMNGDEAARRWGNRTKRTWWIARGLGGASLVAHRGVESSIWHHATLSGPRRERLWAGDVLARRPTPAVPLPQLAEVRMEVCSRCPSGKWRLGACRCRNAPGRIDHATAHDPELYCPNGHWPAPAAAEAP